VEIAGEREDRHDLAGGGDVEAGLARDAIHVATEAGDDVAQVAVVEVHDAAPADRLGIDAQRIAVEDVVVDVSREQIVGHGDGVRVAGQVQVHVLHGQHLRIAAAGRSALDAEHRSKRGLPDARHRALADVPQRLSQPHGGHGLAFAQRCGIDRGDHHVAARGVLGERVEDAQRQLGLVVAVRLEAGVRHAHLSCDIADVAGLGGVGYGDIGEHVTPRR